MDPRERNHQKEIVLSPENAIILQRSPSKLVEDNPASAIINRKTYDMMEAHYSAGLFVPPHIVRVRTYSTERGEEIKEMVVDGLTRTMFAHKHGFEKINVVDVTRDYLDNPIINTSGEKDRDTLTMSEYLQAVVPPTVEHKEIASDRIAAHLINGWSNMVGESVAEHFSPLAAMNILTRRGAQTATDNDVRKFIDEQSQLVVDEKPEERERIKQAMVDMAIIIRKSTSLGGGDEITRSAFALVGAGSEIIGGPEESRKLIHRFLYMPEIERKLNEAYPQQVEQQVEREQARLQLADHLEKTYRRVAGTPNFDQAFKVIREVLQDDNFSLNRTIAVCSADSPLTKQHEIGREISKEKVHNAYVDARKREELSGVELQLLNQLGNLSLPNDVPVSQIVRNVAKADRVVHNAQAFRRELLDNRELLLSQGVNSEIFDTMTQQIIQAEEALLSTDTYTTLGNKTDALVNLISSSGQNITRSVRLHKAALLIDQVYGEELQTGVGLHARLQIANYFISDVATSTDEEILKKIEQFKSLDNDLEDRLRRGGGQRGVLSFDAALKEQDRRRMGVDTQPVVQSIVVEDKDLDEDEVRLNRREQERRRIEINNELLRKYTRIYAQQLRQLELNPREVSDLTKMEGYEMFPLAGNIFLGESDVVGAVARDKVQRERDRIARANRMLQDQEDAQKDARTGR